MTNLQCYCYGVKALDNILKSKAKLTSDTFFNELFYLWDIYSEEMIEEVVRKAEMNDELF